MRNKMTLSKPNWTMVQSDHRFRFTSNAIFRATEGQKNGTILRASGMDVGKRRPNWEWPDQKRY